MARKLSPGENYARTRRKLGLNHEDMGAMLGVRHSTSVRWENGDRKPPPYIDALMVAIYRDAMSPAILKTWMDMARKIVDSAAAP